jgi:hypothetical protein
LDGVVGRKEKLLASEEGRKKQKWALVRVQKVEVLKMEKLLY